MKILKRFLLAIIGIIALLLIVAAFVKKDITIKRTVVINKPVKEVFSYVRHLKNHDNFSVWHQLDPNMKKVYTGEDGLPGFIYAWDGNDDAGKGEQEIKAIEENKKIDIEVRFKKPMEATNQAEIITEPADATTTKVTWSFYSTNPYPMNFMNLFMDGLIGKDLQKNLTNLKAVLEK